MLTGVTWSGFKGSDGVSQVGFPVSTVAYATLGALIVRRVRNPIGWLWLAAGVSLGLMGVFNGYAMLGITAHPGAVPAPRQVGALSEWLFFPVVAVLACALLLFPTGTLRSRRWRPVVVLNFLVTGLLMIVFILAPRPVGLPAPGGVSLTYQNPFGVPAVGSALSGTPFNNINSLTLLSLPFLAAGALSLVLRYRAGGGELRRQINWVALAGAAFALVQLVAIVGIVADHGKLPPITGAAYAASAFIGLLGFPAAITVGILKYRLYEIDVIINRAVVYGLVSAGLTAVYAGIVLGIGALAGPAGQPGPDHRGGRHGRPAVPARAAAGPPGRQPAGVRGTGHALSGAVRLRRGHGGAARLRRSRGPDGDGAGAAPPGPPGRRPGSGSAPQLRPMTIWPHGSAPPAALPLAARPPDDGHLPAFDGVTRAVAVRHGNELLGALALQKPANEPLTAAEDKLLQHLASQAGLVFRNRRLTAELRATIAELTASRRRLVGAQDAERRKIERNLHDGAQQQLVALSIQLGLLEESAGDPGSVRQLAPQLKSAVRAALDDLRDLARGIYPPLLAEQGLAAALLGQVRKVPLPVSVEAEGIGRYPQDTESTVYFCTLEALQNVAKYAAASQVTVGLSGAGGGLQFRVTDDGAGFDPGLTRKGTGLQGMADRLAALGGTLHVHSQPGYGTTVQGWLPVPAGRPERSRGGDQLTTMASNDMPPATY